jgi:hypothetical protein
MSSRGDFVLSQALIIAGQLPLFLVWLIGLIVAIVRWGRHPRVSGLILVGVFAAAGATFGAQIVFRLIPVLFKDGDFGRIFPLVSGFASLVHALAWTCLLLAAFSGREATPGNTPFGAQDALPPVKPPKVGGV